MYISLDIHTRYYDRKIALKKDFDTNTGISIFILISSINTWKLFVQEVRAFGGFKMLSPFCCCAKCSWTSVCTLEYFSCNGSQGGDFIEFL